ncbi:uncharacterized protein si:dkey-20i20.2 [Labeo rohita]|uniref:uncharacterized protein si:dkey-20i20.2 n=1 Tax=Labeo rohita TaxID=84645 RepID=UPI0021E32765|nr:uncharacterized protein si:dkey-20i20.2 [Labeo rohita]
MRHQADLPEASRRSEICRDSLLKDSKNMRDPEPCKMKRTEEQTEMIEENEENEELNEEEEKHHVKTGEKPVSPSQTKTRFTEKKR